MTNKLRKYLSFLLVFALILSAAPFAFAAENAPDDVQPETSEASPPETVSEVPPGDGPGMEAPSADDYGIMPFSANTISGVKLFNQASPNYTVYLPSQIYIKYQPNGSGASKTAGIKNLGWHYASINGSADKDTPLYCIEPHKDFAASTPGNFADQDVTAYEGGGGRGSDVWMAMPESYRTAIALILQFSEMRWDHAYSVASTPMAQNPNVGLRTATQFLIYEIVTGLRDPDSFQRRDSNGYTSGDILYNAGCANVGGFAEHYEAIVSEVQSCRLLPSFTTADPASAPVIDLDDTLTIVTDHNGVLPHYTFRDGDGASFSKHGTDLYIEQTGDIPRSKVFSCTRSQPSASQAAFNIFYSSSSTYQTCVSLLRPETGTVTGYFKLKAQPPTPVTGDLALTKTTSDGQNLQGWRFGIYSDAACTNLVSGPHTTNASGKLNVQGLNAGTYYVKELGHKDAAITAQYTCTSTNPQRVTISAGSTASVKFHNALNTGTLKLEKQTNTGLNLGGWKIGVYTDAACTQAIPGSPFTTAEDGTFLVDGLQPNTYYVKELPGGDDYWECDTSVKTVTVAVNQTATVTFRNTQYGRIQFEKTTNTGLHLAGWVFRVQDLDGKVWGDYTTDATGRAITGNLPLGKYLIQELPTGDDYWQVELGAHDVTVKAGQTVTDKWRNVEQGLGWVHKETNTGESVEGWKIGLYRDEACTQEVAILTTNAEGRAGMYLNPGVYYAKEVGDTLGRFEDEYWMVDERVQRLEIRPHEDTAVTFSNVHLGRLKLFKSMDTDGPLDGWLYKVTAENGAAIEGSPFTSDTKGEILTGRLLPGKYTVEEILPEDSLYYCKSENPQTVIVKAGETAEVHFTNALRPGKITVRKVDSRQEPLAGAKFLLEWSKDGSDWAPIRHTDKKDTELGCTSAPVEDGCLTSGADGVLEWAGLYPGLQYRVTEVAAPEGYTLLTKPAFTGELPKDDLTVELRVVNCPGFTLPKTGSSDMLLLWLLGCAAMTICGAAVYTLRRKRV